MKTLLTIALSAVMALSAAACGGTGPQTLGGEASSVVVGGGSAVQGPVLNGEEPGTAGIQCPSPITEYPSLEEAAAAAGFSMTVPETLEEYPERVFQVFNVGSENVMLEVICREDADSEQSVYIRKAPGTEDISGDYNCYSESRTVTVGDTEVTLKGGNGQVHLATWTAGDYTYSLAVYGEEGVSGEAMTALVAEVR